MLNYKLLLVFILSFGVLYSQAQTDTTITKQKLSFRDTTDNAFDLSSFLLEHRGLLPVPMLITEPALGYGGGLAMIYFHNRKKKYKTYVPPNITGGVGLMTENGTWAAGAFHMHIFGESRVRTMTALMKPNINISYYGNNSEILSNHPLKVKMDSWLFFQRAQVRLAETNFYLGASYIYFESDITLDTIPDRPIINKIISELNVNSVISTLKPMLVYDSRNNLFTPTKGINTELSYSYSAEWLGSSDDYGLVNAKFFNFIPIMPKLFSAYRFEASSLIGDAPFYAYPFISLRGIPAMRYQGNNTMVAETEWRYNIYKRFSVIGFTGAGKAFESANSFNEQEWAYNFGTGFRYEIARMLGVHMGADFAWGNGKDFAFYVVFGTSWF